MTYDLSRAVNNGDDFELVFKLVKNRPDARLTAFQSVIHLQSTFVMLHRTSLPRGAHHPIIVGVRHITKYCATNREWNLILSVPYKWVEQDRSKYEQFWNKYGISLKIQKPVSWCDDTQRGGYVSYRCSSWMNKFSAWGSVKKWNHDMSIYNHAIEHYIEIAPVAIGLERPSGGWRLVHECRIPRDISTFPHSYVHRVASNVRS